MDKAKVGFIGLGAMGLGMAKVLLRAGFHVKGYDVSESAMRDFKHFGGSTALCPAEAARDVMALILMVINSEQVEDVLFGCDGAISAMSEGTIIILGATVSPGYVEKLETRLSEEQRGLLLVDAPVSGGVIGATSGTLTIMASGTEEALDKARPILSAMSEKLYTIGGGVGTGCKVKVVNQVLAGVQIAAAAEAMVLGASAGINTRVLYDIISNAAGSSWRTVMKWIHICIGNLLAA